MWSSYKTLSFNYNNGLKIDTITTNKTLNVTRGGIVVWFIKFIESISSN